MWLGGWGSRFGFQVYGFKAVALCVFGIKAYCPPPPWCGCGVGVWGLALKVLGLGLRFKVQGFGRGERGLGFSGGRGAG